MPGHSFHEEIPPNIQTKPPLEQLEAVPSHPIPCSLIRRSQQDFLFFLGQRLLAIFHCSVFPKIHWHVAEVLPRMLRHVDFVHLGKELLHHILVSITPKDVGSAQPCQDLAQHLLPDPRNK